MKKPTNKDGASYQFLVGFTIFTSPPANNDATAKFVKAIIYIYISTNGDIGVCKSYQVLVGRAIVVTLATSRKRFYSNTVIYLLIRIKHIYFNTVIKT
jgi:hypothetical protein